jgi:hypothetical protein
MHLVKEESLLRGVSLKVQVNLVQDVSPILRGARNR